MLRLIAILSLFLALAFARAARADDAPPVPTTSLPTPTPTPVPAQPPALPVLTKRKRRVRVPVGVRAARYARHLLGVRYEYGGTSPRTGFDCSGFVRFVWSHFGVHLPRVSYSQFDTGRRVGRRGLRPGDLVFFAGAGHVGLYIGNGRFIHAPHTGTRVSISSLGGAYGAEFAGARRVD
jgi:cell wall-associated NlpC family hydrolase